MPICSGCSLDLTLSRLGCLPLPICQVCRAWFCSDCSSFLTHDDRLFDRFGTQPTEVEFYDPDSKTVYDLPVLPEMACDRCYDQPEVMEPETPSGVPIRLVPDTTDDQSFLTLQLRPRALQLVQADGRYTPPTERDLLYLTPTIKKSTKTRYGQRREFEDGTITWDTKQYPLSSYGQAQREAFQHDRWTSAVDDLVHEALVYWIETYLGRHDRWCIAHPDAKTSPYWSPYYAHVCLKRAQASLTPKAEMPRSITFDPAERDGSTNDPNFYVEDIELALAEVRSTTRETAAPRTLIRRTFIVALDPDLIPNRGPGYEPEQILLQKEALWEQYALTQDTTQQAEIAYQIQTYYASLGEESESRGLHPRYRLPPPDYIPISA